MMATLGDGVCMLTARPDGMPTRRDVLPTLRDGVCTQKCDGVRTESNRDRKQRTERSSFHEDKK